MFSLTLSKSLQMQLYSVTLSNLPSNIVTGYLSVFRHIKSRAVPYDPRITCVSTEHAPSVPCFPKVIMCLHNLTSLECFTMLCHTCNLYWEFLR